MRKMTLTLFSLLGTAALAGPCAQAQAQEQQQDRQQQDQGVAEVRGTASMNPMQMLSPDRMADPRGSYQDVRGSYPMSQGQWLNVGIANHKLVAELNERGPVELVQVGQNRFVAKGQPLTLVFYQGFNGDQIEVSYVPDAALASAAPAYVTVALNR